MKVALKPHPELDFFIGFMGGSVIPTKQDKFKPIFADSVTITKDGKESELDADLDFYVKKKSVNSLKEFEKSFTEFIKTQLKAEHPYPKNIKIEVIISVSMTEKRLKEVDIDNLTKSILDCFTGTVFEDDSQVVNIYSSKNVNEFMQLNGLMVGVRKIESKEDSWFDDIKLAYLSDVKE